VSDTSRQLPGGLLAVFVDVPGDLKSDFDRWYETEHLPTLRALPGFRSATLYGAVEGSPTNLAMYQLDSPEALQSPEYLQFRRTPDSELGGRVRAGWKDHTRLIYRLRLVRGAGDSGLIEAPYISAVRVFVKEGSEADFRKWLDEEHSVRQLAVQGAVSYHGFELIEGGPFHFLNVWGMDSPDVGSSEEWDRARDTPWRAEIAPVMEKSLRGTYRPLLRL
jgi:hypothetical protein